MTDRNQVTITSNCFYGYIDDSTPCGKAKAKQVKDDMETLATMLQDNNLSPETKKAIYIDYAEAIREYVEREETCCDCTNDCDYEEEEPYEEEEEPTMEEMTNFSISTNGTVIECDSYTDTIDKIMLLEELKLGYNVYAYDSEDNEYHCRVTKEREEREEIYLELDN